MPYLKARGEVRLDEAAVALGVSAEQLLKDLKVLWMCGTPGGMPDDLIDVDVAALEPEDGDGIRTDGIIRVSNADYLAKPLRLTTTEATALIVALRALRSGAGDDTREVVDRALAKLEAAAAEGAEAARVDPGTRRRGHRPGAPGDPPAGRRGPPAAGPAQLLRALARRAVRAGGGPAGGRQRARGTPTSTPGATSPRRPGCSGSTGS